MCATSSGETEREKNGSFACSVKAARCWLHPRRDGYLGDATNRVASLARLTPRQRERECPSSRDTLDEPTSFFKVVRKARERTKRIEGKARRQF